MSWRQHRQCSCTGSGASRRSFAKLLSGHTAGAPFATICRGPARHDRTDGRTRRPGLQRHPVRTRIGSTEDLDRPARRWTVPPETALGRARRSAQFMPLIQAWDSPGPERPALTAAERDLLIAVQLSVRRGTNLLIRLPGGIHRLPLLAAVMIAAETLHIPQAELSSLSGAEPPPGPVALVSPRLVRRAELDQLDASSAPVAPALRPHRLRGDGLASPLRGGRPRLVTGAARLLFVSPTTGFPPVVGVQPRVVVVDAAAEPGADWIATASDWAAAHRSVVVTVVDLHEEVALPVPWRISSPPFTPRNRIPPPVAITRGSLIGRGCAQRVTSSLENT